MIGGKPQRGSSTADSYNDREKDMNKALDKNKRTFVNCPDASQTAVLDSCTLHYAFAPSGAIKEGKGREGDGRCSHGGTTLTAYSAGEESDLSLSSFTRDRQSYGKNWRLSSPTSYNIFNGGRCSQATIEQNNKARRKMAKKGGPVCSSGGIESVNEALVSSFYN